MPASKTRVPAELARPKSPTVLVPPLSLVTFLTIWRVPAWSLLVIVQTTAPPLGTVTEPALKAVPVAEAPVQLQVPSV